MYYICIISKNPYFCIKLPYFHIFGIMFYSYFFFNRYTEYDAWRYKYPEFVTTQKWAKVPSKKLSDFLVKKHANDS